MMKQTPRPRSYKDERDEMIDRETNGAALDAIITGAEVLAEIVMTAQGDVPDELEALFRVYDGEMFFAQQTEIVDRILENLRKES